MANLCVTYLLWLVGGFFGLHHLYLGRYKQAFLWWCFPGGYFGAGWIRDIWRIPEYVKDANNEAEHVRSVKEMIKEKDIPPWKMARWMGMLVVGNLFGMLPGMAIPNKDDLGMDLWFLKPIVNPLGAAIGIWLVGNIGRWEGSIKYPLIGCYLTTPLYFFGINAGSLTTLVGAHFFRRQWRKERDPAATTSARLKQVAVLVMCGALYASLWTSYFYFNAEVVHNGDKIKFRDAVGNFIKSPLVQEFRRHCYKHWQHMLEHGFWSTWSNLLDSLDPFGEKNALKVLGLQAGSTQDQIKSRYRELSKQWHPDKVKENKAEAQEKFVEIQKAYETLSSIKSRRMRVNRRSATASATAGTSDSAKNSDSGNEEDTDNTKEQRSQDEWDKVEL